MAKVLPKSSKTLAHVGSVVRSFRKERGWTLRELAERTGLSPRFCSQIEAGQGNIAIGRLAVIAEAFGVPLARLVVAPDDPRGRLLDLVANRPRADLRRCVNAVEEALAERTRFVALWGLRGAGKSTFGARAAAALGVEFVELDERIEAAAGLSLGEIFALHGEPYYRRLESECLARLVNAKGSGVVALPGGVVTNSEAFALAQRHATTVWLTAAPEDHMQRVLDQGDRRPMAERADAMAELRAILTAREPFYGQADLVVDTSAEGLEGVLGVLLERLAGVGWGS
jgi:XRE family aerobic/anaerobic benzoate catabolism transcriptional regulator